MAKTELTERQSRRRKHLEQEIRDSARKMGENLLAIHSERLYQSTHDTWEDYCRETWGMSRQHAERIIDHGKVLKLLETDESTAPIGAVLKESATRELSDLPDNEKVEVLKEAAETAPKDKSGKPKVTANHVRETREKREPAPEVPPAPGNVHPMHESVVQDAVDRPVPDHLKDCYESGAAIRSASTRLDAVKREVKELCNQPGGEFIPLSEVEDSVKRLKKLIADSRYWTECPRCCGRVKKDCKRCDGAGFIPFSRRGVLSSEEKEWLGI